MVEAAGGSGRERLETADATERFVTTQPDAPDGRLRLDRTEALPPALLESKKQSRGATARARVRVRRVRRALLTRMRRP